MLCLADLEAFVRVAEAGGVSAAARRLGVAKSIVSRSLQRLEAELGTQLFARTTRGATMTEAGAALREHAERVVAELEAAREAMDPAGDLRGVLRVAAPLSLGPARLAPLLAKLAKQHPRLHVHTVFSDQALDLVAEGFDVALRVGRLTETNMVVRRIGSIPSLLVASPAYLGSRGAPRTPADLLEHEFLMQGSDGLQLLDGAKLVTVHPRGRFRANSGTAIAAAALVGLGIAALPDFLVEEPLASGALIRVLPEYSLQNDDLYVLRLPGKNPPRKVRVVIDLVVEHFAALPREGGGGRARHPR